MHKKHLGTSWDTIKLFQLDSPPQLALTLQKDDWRGYPQTHGVATPRDRQYDTEIPRYRIGRTPMRGTDPPRTHISEGTQTKKMNTTMIFRFASSNGYDHTAPLQKNEKTVNLWTDPTPRDAMAKDRSTQEAILLRNERQWASATDYANHFMHEKEFANYIRAGLQVTPEALKGEEKIETLRKSMQRLQEQFQARDLMGLIPVLLRKDITSSKQAYLPAEYATLNLYTTHEQRSADNGVDTLQQIPTVMELVAALTFGERMHERKGVCPQFVQIPYSKMLPNKSETVSEKIVVEIIFPDHNKIGITLQVRENDLNGSTRMEYLDVRITSYNKASTTDQEIIGHWSMIRQNLPNIRSRVSSPAIPSFLKKKRPQRKNIRIEDVAFLNHKKARRVQSLKRL